MKKEKKLEKENKILNYLKKNSKKIVIFLFVCVCLFRVWLLYSTNWYINIETYYDSHLEINQAVNILNGNWLGGYNKFILCKNPIYPIFLALIYVLHLPYAYGLGLLMIGTCLLFVKAIKPMVKNDYLRLGIFTFLLYQPAINDMTYHYRNSILPWLVLATISCIIGIYLRKEEKIKKIIPYALIGMISMGSFYYLREDSIWLLPFAVAAYIIGVITLIIKKELKKKIVVFALISALPLCGIPVFHHVISSINYKHYGIYAANDRMETNTAKLLGLLIEIDDGSDLDHDVWVSGKAIELAQEVSPTFASLKLSAFDAWSKYGDHSIWALRDVLTNSGYFVDARKTDEVCGKIIKELKTAFKKGKLKKKKGLKLSDTSGIFSDNEVKKSFGNAFDVFKYHITYDNVNYIFERVKTYSDEIDLELYEQTLGINLMRTEKDIGDLGVYPWGSHSMFNMQNENHRKQLWHNLFFMNIILAVYQHTDILLFALATIGFAFILFKLIRKDKKLEFKLETLIIMGGLLLLTYLNAYIVCLWGSNFLESMYNDIVYNYTTIEYLLIELYEIFGIIFFIELIKDLISLKKNKSEKKDKTKSKKKTKKEEKKGINELISYMVKFDINNLFRTKTDNTFIQFFRYLFVGGFAAVVNIGMLYVFTDIVKIYYVISNVLAFILGLLVNYILSKKFVFQDETSINKSKEFIIYAIIGVIGLGIDTLLVWLFTDIIKIYYLLSKIISTGIVFIWNFGARKILYKVIK